MEGNKERKTRNLKMGRGKKEWRAIKTGAERMGMQ